MNSQLILSDYNVLRDEIAQVLAEGKERARLAVEREKVWTYHDVGRLLHEYVLANKERAEYGEGMIARLGEELGLRKRLLYEALQFYRAFRNVPSRAQLSWSHYRKLLGLRTAAERSFYVQEAGRQGWSVSELGEQVKAGAFERTQAVQAADRSEPDRGRPLAALRGQLYTYRVIASPDRSGLRLDLGFGIHPAWALGGLKNPRAGMVVEATKGRSRQGDKRRRKATRGRADERRQEATKGDKGKRQRQARSKGGQEAKAERQIRGDKGTGRQRRYGEGDEDTEA